MSDSSLAASAVFSRNAQQCAWNTAWGANCSSAIRKEWGACREQSQPDQTNISLQTNKFLNMSCHFDCCPPCSDQMSTDTGATGLTNQCQVMPRELGYRPYRRSRGSVQTSEMEAATFCLNCTSCLQGVSTNSKETIPVCQAVTAALPGRYAASP